MDGSTSMNFDLEKATIYKCLHGSHVYGLNTEDSDIDIKGICIPPKNYYFGYLNKFEQYQKHSGEDITIYDIKKFFKLAADCNPSIIEVLWVNDKHILFANKYGRHIRDNKEHFISKKARYTFSGYAIAQLKRIKTHRKYLLEPPNHKPSRDEFSLPNTSLLNGDIMGSIESFYQKNNDPVKYFSSLVMDVYKKERSYHNKLREWEQYQNWIKTRNPKRAELEKKYGYDAKHASHLVRLLRMCREILLTGEVIVERPDRDELLSIKNGAWSYDKLINWAEEQDKEMEELYDKSDLPRSPNHNLLDDLCVDIIETYLGDR